MGRPKTKFRNQVEQILGCSDLLIYSDPRKGGCRRVKICFIHVSEDKLEVIRDLPYVEKVENWIPDNRSYTKKVNLGDGYWGLAIHLDRKPSEI